MGVLADRVTARVTALQAHLDEIQTRADAEKGQVQAQIDALREVQQVLTPRIEQAFARVIALQLLPREGA